MKNETKKLIINADDFGMCHSYNLAVFDLFRENRISTATLMPVTPGREEAAAWCAENRTQNVGLHTTLTSEWGSLRWSSLTGLPSLEDENGYLHRTVSAFLQKAQPAQIGLELEAQMEWVENMGIRPSHVDNHMGTLYPHPEDAALPNYLPLALDFCHRHGRLPFRIFRRNYWNSFQLLPASSIAADIAYGEKLGVGMVDTLYSYPFSPLPGETYASFKQEIQKLLYALPEGVSEIYFHPSVESEEVKGICGSWQRRVWEYRLLLDDDLTYTLRDAGISRITYQQLRAMRERE